jgi:tRNA threonylcarbamoyl adenosine modification protein (Sua5/YciO/YrdC/YwlC family)
MKMLTKAYLEQHKAEIIKEMKEGKVFVYPTDTIYGIGCNALNEEGVLKIRELKRRDGKPFSVIAPNVEWINENCVANKIGAVWVKKLPGPYTLILPLRNKAAVVSEVVANSENIGIRMPNHWFSDLVKEAGIPFVTTSANVSGEPTMTDFYSLDSLIREQVDYIIYEGALHDKPSTIVDLTGDKEKIIER